MFRVLFGRDVSVACGTCGETCGVMNPVVDDGTEGEETVVLMLAVS